MEEMNVDMYAGLRALYKECARVYPDQLNPLQVNSFHKFWLGGPDPLDYISMYVHPGYPKLSVPTHWHYVSFGLSDLHGDGRVYPIKPKDQENSKSGFGFELSFRLRREKGDEDIPLWPASVMQALAKYIFKSGNPLLPGDHVSWHQSLSGEDSNIIHMLLTADPEFEIVNTPFGTVQFVEIVGITSDELEAVQHWNGASVIELMKNIPECGGKYLVTNMQREQSVFQIDPSLRDRVLVGIDHDGSNLSGVTAECSWSNGAWKFYDETNLHYLKPQYRTLNISLRKQHSQPSTPEIQLKPHEAPGLNILPELREECEMPRQVSPLSDLDEDINDHKVSPHHGTVETQDGIQLEEMFNDLRMSCSGNDLSSDDLVKDTDYHGEISYFDNIHLTLNLEAGLLIPLALKGRVRHGRHFSFKSGVDDFTITFVSSSVQGSFATMEHPFASQGVWLHILLQEDLLQAILTDFEVFLQSEAGAFPKTFLWPEFYLAITIKA